MGIIHYLLPILMCRLLLAQELDLYENNIGDDGMIAFSDAISKGALPSLRSMSLDGNPGNDAPAKKALAERKK